MLWRLRGGRMKWRLRSWLAFLAGVSLCIVLLQTVGPKLRGEEPLDMGLVEVATVGPGPLGSLPTAPSLAAAAMAWWPGRTPEHTGCPIPQLRPDDPVIAKFFHSAAPLKCKAEPAWTHIDDQLRFQISKEAIAKHGAIKCSYTHFWRESDHRTLTKTYEDFPSGSKLKGDYAKVSCKGADGAKYSNLHASLVPDPAAIERARQGAKSSDAAPLSVIVLGFDSVSRMTFMRKMPLTYRFLTETLSAVVLKGYNIVGDGTPQAFIPILTGKTEEELPLTRKRYPKANFVDVYPMVWKEFAKRGFVTLYGEDSAAIGTFTYRLKGFRAQPTDHYTRTFYSLAEAEYKHHPRFCFWDRPQHRTFWDINEHFLLRYPADVRKFSLMHYSYLTHDDVNTPQLVDADVRAHLQRLKDAGVLDRSLLVLMADHGHRFAKLRATQQGQLEERLPFFSLAAPEAWRKAQPEAWANLEANANLLTSPFDIHATLEHLLHWRAPQRVPVTTTLPRSLSLFDAIPMSRTCAQAGIANHWCACLNWESVSLSDPTVLHVSHTFIRALNNETQRERSLCAPLRVLKLESAKRLVPHSDLLKYKDAKDKDGFVPDLSGKGEVQQVEYQLRVRTTPGDGLFEATLPYDLQTKTASVDLNVVSHINKFGDLPHCIIDKDYFLAKYCVCYDKITQQEKAAGAGKA